MTRLAVLLLALVLAGCSLARLRCEGPEGGRWIDGRCVASDQPSPPLPISRT